MSAKLLKKISPATVCKDKLKRLDVEGAPKEVVLYDVYGIVAKVKSGSTSMGEFVAFVGEIEATTPDGEVFKSPKVFLAQPLEDMLFTSLMQAHEADPGATVQFAARVSIVPPTPGKASATGYEYRVVPLVEAQDSNPMKSLREQAVAALKQLSAPVKTTETIKASDTAHVSSGAKK